MKTWKKVTNPNEFHTKNKEKQFHTFRGYGVSHILIVVTEYNKTKMGTPTLNHRKILENRKREMVKVVRAEQIARGPSSKRTQPDSMQRSRIACSFLFSIFQSVPRSQSRLRSDSQRSANSGRGRLCCWDLFSVLPGGGSERLGNIRWRYILITV